MLQKPCSPLRGLTQRGKLLFKDLVIVRLSQSRSHGLYDHASRSLSRYALKSSTCEQVYVTVYKCSKNLANTWLPSRTFSVSCKLTKETQGTITTRRARYGPAAGQKTFSFPGYFFANPVFKNPAINKLLFWNKRSTTKLNFALISAYNFSLATYLHL